MKKFILETLYAVAFTVVATIILFLAFYWMTGKDQWYANAHDEKCEGTHCHCYERFTMVSQKKGE